MKNSFEWIVRYLKPLWIRVLISLMLGYGLTQLFWMTEFPKVSAFIFDTDSRLAPKIPVDPRIVIVDTTSFSEKAGVTLGITEEHKLKVFDILEYTLKQQPLLVVFNMHFNIISKIPEDLERFKKLSRTNKNLVFADTVFWETPYFASPELYKDITFMEGTSWDLVSGAADQTVRRWSVHSGYPPPKGIRYVLVADTLKQTLGLNATWRNPFYFTSADVQSVFARFRDPKQYPVISGLDIRNGKHTNLANKIVIIGEDAGTDSYQSKKTAINPNPWNHPLRAIYANHIDDLLNNTYIGRYDKNKAQLFSFLAVTLTILGVALAKPIISLVILSAIPVVVLSFQFFLFTVYFSYLETSNTLIILIFLILISIPLVFIRMIYSYTLALRQKDAEVLRQQIESRVLSQAARADVLEKVALRLAHDIRTPFSAVQMAALATESWDPNISAMLKQSADRISRLAEDLLKPFRTSGSLNLTESQSYSLSKLINSTVSAFKVSNPSIEFLYDLGDDVFTSIPLSGLEATLNNLIVNAIEARPLNKERHKIIINFSANDGFAFVRVSDSGSGIANEIKGKLFSKGVTYGKKTGTGLGLFESREFMRSHSGDLLLESTSGNGTVFLIKIPLAQIKAINPKKDAKILALDDSIEVLNQLRISLKSYNDTVFDSDLDKYLNHPEMLSKFDTFIIDLIFANSEHNGFELIQVIRELDQKHKRLSDVYLYSSLGSSESIHAMATKYDVKVVSKNVAI